MKGSIEMNRIVCLLALTGMILSASGCIKSEQTGKPSQSPPILVATMDLSAGTVLKAKHLRVSTKIQTTSPNRYVQPQTIDRAVGHKLQYLIKKGNPVAWADLKKQPEKN